MERKTEEDVVMRTWKMEVGGDRKLGRSKLGRSDVIRRQEGETSTDRRSARPENIEIENSTRRPEMGKWPNKKF